MDFTFLRELSGAEVSALVKDMSAAVAIIVGVLTALRVANEMRNNREQRERALTSDKENRDQRDRELRWRQAQAGSALVEKMVDNKDAVCAMRILDWSNRKFEVEGVTVAIAHDDLPDALRTSRGRFDSKQVFIRDVFDELFFHMARFEQTLDVGLVRFADVSLPIGYYVTEMAKMRRVFEPYLETFHPGAHRFVERFPEWKQADLRAVPEVQAQTA